MDTYNIAGRCCLRRIGSENSKTENDDILWLDSEINTIGRNKTCVDLFIDSSKYRALVSRLHARIVKIKGSSGNQYELYDTSLNGTYLNDIRVNGSVLLKGGDVIAFGHIRGVTIAPGEYAPQPESELRYQFEEHPAAHVPESPSPAHKSKEDTVNSTLEKTPRTSAAPSCFLTPPMTPGTPLSTKMNLKQRKRPPANDVPTEIESKDDGDKVTGSISPEGQNKKLYSYSDHTSLDEDGNIPSSQDSPALDDDIFALVAKISSNIAKEPEEEEEDSSFDLGKDVKDDTSTEEKEAVKSGDSTVMNNCHLPSPPLADIYGPSRLNNGKDYRDDRKQGNCHSVSSEGILSKPHTLPKPSIQGCYHDESKPKGKERGSSPESLKSLFTREKRKRDSYYHERCASSDCVHPCEDILTWVECADCLKWYHIKCVGLTAKEAKRKNNSFQCGC